MSFQGRYPVEQLPLFVYGTFRREQQNYMLLRGHTLSEEPAFVQGMSLYSLRAYPFGVWGSHRVIGELMIINPRIYYSLLAKLDRVEGHDPQAESWIFRREQCLVTTEHQDGVRAWVYIGNADYVAMQPHIFVPHGDWTRYRRELIMGTRFGRFVPANSSNESPAVE